MPVSSCTMARVERSSGLCTRASRQAVDSKAHRYRIANQHPEQSLRKTQNAQSKTSTPHALSYRQSVAAFDATCTSFLEEFSIRARPEKRLPVMIALSTASPSQMCGFV